MKKIELRIILLSIIVSAVLCGIKFYTYFITHSLVILSDALESIINIVAGLFAYYSIYLSHKPRDLEHPYGHGKVEFFSIGFEGAMIFIAGCVILYEAVKHLIFPQSLKELGTGIYLVIISAVINLLLGWFLIYSGKKYNSLTLTGNGKHIISDSYTSFGVLIAVVLIYFTNIKWIDPVASIIAALIILVSGFKLLSKSVSGLMDENDMETVDDVVKILSAQRRAYWIDVHNMRVQRFGTVYHVDCHVTLPYYLTLEQVHEEISSIDKIVNEHFTKGQIEFFIHNDPCIEDSCLHCTITECKVRRKQFVKKIEWSKENALPNRKHFFPE